ncbi:MAG: tetraacyldisaccharide 4'-kinase [Flavobacteriales bacterium]
MKWYNWILLPISLVFWIITTLRNLFFELGLFKKNKFNIPIIGIGNITVGGTGKTPHSQYISELLQHNFKIAVLSKGYGRKTKDFQYVNIDSNTKDVGDEPLQMKKNLPNQIVAVDHKRVEGINKILNEHNEVNCIVLDDAFQHRSVKIGLNILLCDYNNPIYNDWIMPVGLLRESRSEVNRADCMIISKCPENLSIGESLSIKKKLNFKKEIFYSKIIYDKIVSLKGNKTLEKASLKKVLLVTGIANFNPIIEYLESLNIEIKHLAYKDHFKYKKKDIDKIINNYQTGNNERIILTTEKDAQKMKEFEKLWNFPVYYLKVSVDFMWNKDKFEEKIMNYVKAHS